MSEIAIKKASGKALVITASLLGIIQGSIWLLCSILCIFCYMDVIENSYDLNYISILNYIYQLFLENDHTNNIIHTGWSSANFSGTFFIYMWIYIVLSLLWIIISSYLIWRMNQKLWIKVKRDLGLWSLNTITFGIIDIILTVIIAFEFASFISYADSNPSLETETLYANIGLSYGIVMSIVARGYIFLLINFVFAGIMFKFCLDLHRDKGTDDPRRSMLHAYNTSSPPWYGKVDDPWVADDNLNHQTNRAFTHDTNQTRPAFERSESFFPIFVPAEQPNSYPTSYGNINYKNAPSTLDSRQSPSLNRHNQYLPSIKYDPNRPKIPPPDYSPPGTLTGLKSVLRSSSNY